MNIHTTYTVRSKQDGYIWEFKYNLDGSLYSFVILEGKLSGKQMKWLFGNENFPAVELLMKAEWIKNLKSHFEVTVGSPDLSFESFYKLYRHPCKKQMALKSWGRLSKADKIDAIAYIKIYDNYLGRKNVAKAAPSTYLNQRYWEDNHGSIH